MIQQLSSVDQYCCLFHKKHQVTTEFVRRLVGWRSGCRASHVGAGALHVAGDLCEASMVEPPPHTARGPGLAAAAHHTADA
jgi:hypothetical protein